MEGRKGDPIIYCIYGLFLACIVSGGVFLCLYIAFPQSEPWYAHVGLILVGIPWFFWFMAYLYRCIRPCFMHIRQGKQNKIASHEAAPAVATATTPGCSPRTARDSAGDNSPVCSPQAHGERHVQFGSVTLLGSDNGSHNSIDDAGENRPAGANAPSGFEKDDEEESHKAESSFSSRESEMPLRLTATP